MKNKKKIAIGILCVALVFMGIGYSLFSSTLNIAGTSKASGTFNVQITDVDVNDKSAGATDVTTSPGYTEHEANLSATFNAPGDYITYDIEVSNLGTIDALISVDARPQVDTDSNFEMSCNAVNRTELVAQTGTTTFQCTMTFDKDHNLSSIDNVANGSMTVEIQAVQKSSYEIAYVDQDPEESCFVSVIPGEINYYDTSKQGCGTTVTIPNDLRLKTTTVESTTFNNQMCLAFASGIKEDDSITDQQFCDGMNQQIQQMSTSQLFGSMYLAFVTPTFGTTTGDYNVIETIGASAFMNRNLTSITFSDNIEEIKEAAFAYNSSLRGSLTFSSSVTSIGDFAFALAGSFTSVVIPSSVTSFGEQVFIQTNITSLNIDVADIPADTFHGSGIETLILGNHVQTIGESAFENNQLSGTLTIPSSVTSIGEFAFVGIKDAETNNITSVVFAPNSNIQNIGKNILHYHHNITSINTNMTSQEWSLVTKDSDWLDGTGSPTVITN